MSIITHVDEPSFEELLKTAASENRKIVLKFGATWCGPCKRVKGTWDQFVPHLLNQGYVGDIDVDESPDLYAKLKRYRMVRGIPSFLIWFPKPNRDVWYVPDMSLATGDAVQVSRFLNEVLNS